MGDPAGVGPELLLKAWLARGAEGFSPFAAIGGAGLLAAAARHCGLNVPVQRVASLAEAGEMFTSALPVIGDFDADYHPGAPDPAGARLALQSLTEASRLTVSGETSAMVTGPVAKSRLAEVGFVHPGQTEFVAEACGIAAGDAVMMLAGPRLRTVPLTVHVALSAVPGLISADMIVRKARIVAAALRRDFGLETPRLAIAALNPHAGEQGLMGDEDGRIIVPAIARLQAEGITSTGPHPADALFAPHERSGYDVALCMYHDQALIPIKALDFDQGVNVTLGLPIIRTSPDHGTAFGIAGKGLANPGAMLAAIRMAGECAAQRGRSHS